MKLVYCQIFVFFSIAMVSAQVSPTTCWQTTITMPTTQKVYLLGNIKNSNGLVVSQVRSEPMMLKSGINVLSEDVVQTIKVNYFDKETERVMLSTGNFPDGTYELCVMVFPLGSSTEEQTICTTKVSKNTVKSGDTKFKALKFYGQASLDMFYVSPQPGYTSLPASYTRLQFDPGFSLYNVPVSGRLRYTTEKTGPYSEMDMFSLNFDRPTFEKNIKQIILNKFLSAQSGKMQEYAQLTASIKDIDALEQQIKDKGQALIEKQMELAKDSLERFKNKTLDLSKSKSKDLDQRYKTLLAKKNQVDRMVDKYRQMEALKKKWIDSGKLEALKNAIENPIDLSDPKIMIDQLKKMGAYTGMNKLLFNVKELSLGTAYPVYSPLTLNGIQIFGGNVEWNPGLLFVAASTGKVVNTYPYNIDTTSARFSQRMAAARLGFGKIYGSYLALTGVKFWDNATSLTLPKNTELFPESATIGSVDFKISLGKERYFELGGEIAGMFKNQNTNDTLGTKLDLREVPSIIRKNISPNLSSNADFAFNGESSINLFGGRTKLRASANFVGPGYFTPGTFGIQNDLFKQKFRAEQVISKSLKINLFYHKDYDNFSESKGFRTFRNDIGGELVIHNRSGLQTNLRLSRQTLENSFFTYQSTVANLTMIKLFRLKNKSTANTVIGATYFNTETDSIINTINSLFIFVQQSFQNSKGWSINVGVQKAFNKTAAFNGNTSGFNANIGKRMFKKINLSLGARYFDAQNLNNIGYNLSVTGQVIKNLQLNIRALKNDYSVYPNSVLPFNETIIQSGIKYSW